jgi:hypothetical protein
MVPDHLCLGSERQVVVSVLDGQQCQLLRLLEVSFYYRLYYADLPIQVLTSEALVKLRVLE